MLPPPITASQLTGMTRLLLLSLACLGTTHFTNAQANHAPIRVVDGRTSQPIPYASIGVSSKPLGTVADAHGTFPLSHIRAAPSDTLVISCVGFQTQKMTLQDLGHRPEIRLAPQTQTLAEIVVRGRKPKRAIIGHNWVSAFTSYGFYTTADTVPHARLGREIGVLLHIKHPTLLENFHLFTSGRDFKSVMFRLNIYAFENGQPRHSLLRQDIIFTVNGQQRGWTDVDLRPFAITLAGPQQVVATVEWLGSEVGRPGGKFLDIPTHLSAVHTTYSRSKSAQNWTTYGSNPSMYFDALSYPD
jgi:hypothetical protein